MSINRNKLVEEVLEDFRTTLRRIFTASRSDMHGNIIPRSQAIVMHIVNANPGISVKNVAISLDVSPSAATQLIDALVKDGIMIRRPSEQDHRVVCLELSKEGKLRHRKYRAFQLARLHPILDVLTDEELVELSRLHAKILESVTNHPSMSMFVPEKTAKKGSPVG
jgi:DNA-binding MarR family transcriptional regulator